MWTSRRSGTSPTVAAALRRPPPRREEPGGHPLVSRGTSTAARSSATHSCTHRRRPLARRVHRSSRRRDRRHRCRCSVPGCGVVRRSWCHRRAGLVGQRRRIGRTCGATPARCCPLPRSEPVRTGRRPTARSNAFTGPWSTGGLMPVATAASKNDETHFPTGCTGTTSIARTRRAVSVRPSHN